MVNLEQLLQILKATGEETRLRICILCAHSDLTVSELTEILAQSQPRISRHLKILAESGVLERTQEGNWAYFRIVRKGTAGRFVQGLIDEVPGDDKSFALDLSRLERVLSRRAERARQFFNENAQSWDRLRSLYVDEKQVEDALLSCLPEGPIAKHLDIGTGTGRILEVCAPHVSDAVGVDLSHPMLAVARSRLEQARLRRCQVRHGDMYSLPFAASEFDLVTLHHVLHYAEQPQAVVREAARVTAEGGELIIVDFERHAMAELHEEYAHRWLGFDTAGVAEWMTDAGLACEPPVRLEGAALVVVIWKGRSI